MKIEFTKKVRVTFDTNTVRDWLEGRLKATQSDFRKQMSRGSGASSPFTFPINKSGDLSAGTQITVIGNTSGEIGTDVYYAKFLDQGTSKMKPRKMYKDALNKTMKRKPKLSQLAGAVKMVQK